MNLFTSEQDAINAKEVTRQAVLNGMHQFKDAYEEIWDEDIELLCWKACYVLRDKVDSGFWFMTREEKMEHPITTNVMSELVRAIKIHLAALDRGEELQVMH